MLQSRQTFQNQPQLAPTINFEGKFEYTDLSHYMQDPDKLREDQMKAQMFDRLTSDPSFRDFVQRQTMTSFGNFYLLLFFHFPFLFFVS